MTKKPASSVLLEIAPPDIGLEGAEGDLFAHLYKIWAKKRIRNLLRTMYYEGKNALKDFGISVPPQMQSAYTPLMWIAKGVNALVDRSVFEDFVTASGAEDPFGVAEIVYDNDLRNEFPLATKSSAIHACSFLTVSHGDVEAGEPDILVLPRPAHLSAATWDPRRRRLRGFLSVAAIDDDSSPSEIIFYLPDKVYFITKNGRRWAKSVIPNPLGEVSVTRLAYSPELTRPFGNSRISRTAMGLTDAAVRTLLRAEVSAEFYSADKYWLFGADVTKFIGTDKWNALMGRMNAIDATGNEEDKPEIHRFTGSTPQPHTDMIRMLATLFADDQSLAVKWADSSNPSSADAIYAAKEELIMDTRNANRVWGGGKTKAIEFAVRLRDRLDVAPTELRSLAAQYTDPAIVSPSARADAFSKLAANIPGFASTDVGMEYAGLSRAQIIRLKAEQRRTGVGVLTAALRGAADEATAADEEVAAVAGERGVGG